MISRLRIPLVTVAVVVAGVVAVIVATSGASTTKASPNSSAASAISVRHTSLGSTLVDAHGRTLYLFESDKTNQSTLTAAGQAIWPPFTAAVKPQALNGVSAAAIATTSHSGGPAQVTYNGHPLYYYVGDRNPGQVSGQGLNQFGALWYVLGSNGNAVISAPAAQAPATSTGGSAGYGY